MGTPSIKTKFELDGEREYKQALSEINSGLKVLNSEMKLTSAKFDENGESVEALSAKSDVLSRKVLSQKDKIGTLKAALQSSAQKYGEADKKTQQFQTSLNNAERELIGMEKELKQNNDKLKDTKEAFEKGEKSVDKFDDQIKTTEGTTKGFGDIADSIANKLGVNLPEKTRNSLNSFGQLRGKVALLAGGFLAMATAIKKAEDRLKDLTIEQANTADEIITMSEIIGFTTEEYQKWDYVLKTVGWSMEQAQGDISQLAEKAVDAAKGEGEAAEIFSELGVIVEDNNGVMRNQQDIFNDTITALQNMTDKTRRHALASMLMSTTGERLIPIIDGTAESLEQQKKRAEELNYVMSGEQLEALKDVKEAQRDYTLSAEGAKNMIALQFAPALEEFYKMAGDGVKKLGEQADQSGLVYFFSSILEIVVALKPALEILGELLVGLGPIIKTISVSLAIIADALRVIFDFVGGIIGGLFGKGDKYWKDMGGVLSGNDSATKRMLNNMYPANSTGDHNWRGGVTWVGENGPERVFLPRGTQIQNAQESRTNGGNTYIENVTIDAKEVKEINDIIRLVQNQRMDMRRGYARG